MSKMPKVDYLWRGSCEISGGRDNGCISLKSILNSVGIYRLAGTITDTPLLLTTRSY